MGITTDTGNLMHILYIEHADFLKISRCEDRILKDTQIFNVKKEDFKIA